MYDEEDNLVEVSFRDILSGALLIMFLVAALMIALIAPKTPKSDSNEEKSMVRVELIWPPEMNVDIDLWCRAPGDVTVGYSNKSGVVFDLLRDDLGFSNDKSGLNYEIMYSRGAPVGTYQCNAHWYSNHAGLKGPIPLRMILSVTKKDTQVTNVVTVADLAYVNEEITLMRWSLDKDGRVVSDSTSNYFSPLRAMSGK